MWKSFLANSSGIPVEINTDSGENAGLVVATRPHKTYHPFSTFFTNPTTDGKWHRMHHLVRVSY